MELFIDFREQAVRDREEETPNPERVERLLSELAQALDKLPKARREELITKLRSVQLIPASEPSQAEAQFQAPNGTARGRSPKAAECRRIGRGNAMEVDEEGQER